MPKKNTCPGFSMTAAELFLSFTSCVAHSVVNKNNTASSNKTKQQTNPYECSSTCRAVYPLPKESFMNRSLRPVRLLTTVDSR